MSELKNLQTQFQAFLMAKKPAIKKSIIGTKKVSIAERLEVYGDAYQSRLVEALASNYPMLQIYLGEEQFEKLTYAYLKKYPSTYRSVRWFGDQLAYFIKKNKIYKAYPYLVELVQIEWIMTLVFDAKDDSILTLEEMANVAPENWINMRLYLHSSVHLLDLSWNMIAIWQALTDEKTPPEAIKSKSVTWIFWRQELTNHFCSLPKDEAWAIKAVKKGATFGEICQGLCKWVAEDEAAIRAASLLKGWISGKLISSIEV